jgi:hypothetical protein
MDVLEDFISYEYQYCQVKFSSISDCFWEVFEPSLKILYVFFTEVTLTWWNEARVRGSDNLHDEYLPLLCK